MIIQLENISKTYESEGLSGSLKVLDDISLKADTNDAIAIVGPSGCGKSTLLNIMGTLDSPSSGSVKFNDIELSSFNETQLAELRNRKIGFIFQLHHLLPQLTVLENVLLPSMLLSSKTEQQNAVIRAKELLQTVGLADRINQRPGLLSGGECQRTAVVRALINQPDIILADEPTGSLDNETSNQIGELLLNINKEHNVALILVTHSTKLAQKMNDVYTLDIGKLTKSK